MARFLKNLVDYFKEAFEDDEENIPTKKVDEDNIKVRGEISFEDKFDDCDTDAIDVSDLECSEPTDIDMTQVLGNQQTPDYSNYWWCFENKCEQDITTFKEIDPDKIESELNARIKSGAFPIIEVPENVMKAIETLNDPEFDFTEVAALINKSPAMAGEFLSLVNSSSYSRGVKISDLRVALPRVGRENVKAMLYLYSTKMSLVSSKSINDLAISIVEHSYATAIIASYMSQRYFPDPDTAFLAGLLHDVGKLGIIKAIIEDYDFISKIDGNIKEQHFGNTFADLHGAVGKNLAEVWNIDKLVVSSIEHHHDFFDFGCHYEEQEQFSLSALINLSDTMARILGKGRPIESVNIFDLASTRELNIEANQTTFDFLDELPGIISFKSS